jgi:hypothetical protein
MSEQVCWVCYGSHDLLANLRAAHKHHLQRNAVNSSNIQGLMMGSSSSSHGLLANLRAANKHHLHGTGVTTGSAQHKQSAVSLELLVTPAAAAAAAAITFLPTSVLPTNTTCKKTVLIMAKHCRASVNSCQSVLGLRRQPITFLLISVLHTNTMLLGRSSC